MQDPSPRPSAESLDQSGDRGERTFDAAVIGAGPAGSIAALTLARAGASVLVIERAKLPRYKTCGGGIVGRALRSLPADVELPLEHRCLDIAMSVGAGARTFTVQRREPIVAMVMRAQFDEALVRAAERAGATLIAPCELEGIESHADSVELATSTGRFRARFVIGADGALGTTARLAGWTDRVHTIPALEAEVVLAPAAFERLRSTARFDLGVPEGGYGWIFPKRRHVSAGVLTMRRGSFDLRGALARYLEMHVGPSAKHDIVSIEHHGYVIPVSPRRSGFTRGRVLLAGDAAGLADPLTGEGISYALESGRLAACALLDGDFDPRAVRARYRAALRTSMLPELRVARALAHVLYRRPRIAARLFERAGQRLCEAMTDVVCGNRSYRELALDPRNYWKLVVQR